MREILLMVKLCHPTFNYDITHSKHTLALDGHELSLFVIHLLIYVDSSISVLTNLVIKKLITGEYENAF